MPNTPFDKKNAEARLNVPEPLQMSQEEKEFLKKLKSRLEKVTQGEYEIVYKAAKEAIKKAVVAKQPLNLNHAVIEKVADQLHQIAKDSYELSFDQKVNKADRVLRSTGIISNKR